MNRVQCFVGGVVVGLVAGSRIGRRPYDEVAGRAHRAWANPRVRSAANLMHDQATRLYDHRIRPRLHPNGSFSEETLTDTATFDGAADR